MHHPARSHTLAFRAGLCLAAGLLPAASVLAAAQTATAGAPFKTIAFPDETKYELATNAWGYQNLADTGWEINIFTVGTTPTRNAWGYKWRNLSSVPGHESDVKAYPGIRMGAANSNPSDADGLPARVGDGKNIYVKWVFSVTGYDSTGTYTGVINTTLDLFFSSNHSNDRQYRKGEIMIMPYWTQGGSEWGTAQGQYTDPSGTLWNMRLATMNSGGYSWPVYQFKRVTNGTTLNIDVKDFIAKVKSKFNPADWDNRYVLNVEAGTEIKWGSGRIYTTEYYSNVQ